MGSLSVCDCQVFNSCYAHKEISVAIDVILLISTVVLFTLGILASLGKLHFLAAASIGNYCLYGSGGLLLLLEIIKQSVCKSDEKNTTIEPMAEPSYPTMVPQAEPAPAPKKSTGPGKKFSTALKLGNYLCGLVLFSSIGKKSNMETSSYNLAADLLFHERPEAALLTKKGIGDSDKHKANPDFVYSPLLELRKEDFNTDTIKNILNQYIEENKARSIPKLFVSTAVEPTVGVPHALLLVIEANPHDLTEARITLVDSFGGSAGYRVFKEKMLRTAQECFPSPKSKIVYNAVAQQEDGWSCGWHMLANVDLLSQQPNVQEFVQNHMPKRPNIEGYQCKFYETHVFSAARKWRRAVPKEVRKPMIDSLFSKKHLIGDVQGEHKEWYEEIIEVGVILKPTLK